MAYLYNALILEGLLPDLWQDMEYFLILHGEEGIFLGDPPKTLDAHDSHLKLVTGTSLTAFAKESARKKVSNVRLKDRRRVIKVPEIMSTFKDLLLKPDTDKFKTAINQIEASLQRQADLRQGSMKKDSPSGGQWKKTHLITPVQLLTAWEESMVPEEAKLVFPYHFLHRTCWSLLKAIEKTMHNGFSHWKLEILQIASDSHIDPTLNTLPQCIFSVIPPAKRKDLLQRAAATMQGFMNAGGKSRSDGVDGTVDTTDVPELGPATLWGILEPRHSTWRGECIHWGPCDR